MTIPIQQPIHCFSITYPHVVNTLELELKVSQAFNPTNTSREQYPTHFNYFAIWDTGATNSVITNKVVTDIGLKPIGMRKVHGVHGADTTNVYSVNILLPNKVGFSTVGVTEGKLPGRSEVLIGMDIISRGDFVLTHKDGKTLFSFRFPPIGHIDFAKKVAFGATVGRDQPCPCGSKEKFKRCCGR